VADNHRSISSHASSLPRNKAVEQSEEMGIYMEDTEDKRPLFDFYIRPWKVEKTIQTDEACGIKLGDDILHVSFNIL